ncbi:MAG: hypothetical protein JRN21_01875 [Nitrososphaerota archaeon]|nr:hypothetical protein [Nitrososphaerota archaeon]
MDSDDVTYRKNVRNMSVVLAAIVLTIFAALFVPPYFASPNVFQTSVSVATPFGFSLNLALNSTSASPAGGVLLTGWLNSTESSVNNVTASVSWAFPPTGLWLGTDRCTAGWPLGIGVMQGHYTQDNYTLGSLLPFMQPLVYCPVTAPPQFFLLYPHSSEALAVIGGNPFRWVLNDSLPFSSSSLAPGALRSTVSGLPPGVYTAVLADEWGDVLTANFRVT